MRQSNALRIFLVAIYFLLQVSENIADRPCAARQIANQSIVCVCNAMYCDEITRDVPRRGQYVTYTSSAAGSRFKKGSGYFSSSYFSYSNIRGQNSIELDASQKYQKIQGFGGAVTDSASMNWKSLPEAAQQHLINSYFSKNGLEYNMIRLPIACTDFSIRHYSYDDIPDDYNLDQFSLQNEDYYFKIPMLKQIFNVATAPVQIVTAYWSPPPWMKYTTETNTHCGYLKRKYYQTFADYLLKFIDSYEKEGIRIWGISTGNEPSLERFSSIHTSCLGWDNYNMGNWIVNNLGPTIRNSKYRHVKILALDDQLYTIKVDFDDMVRNNSKVLDYVDGIAVHYYTNCYVSPKILKHVTKAYPKLFVISTEACEGYKESSKGIIYGSWKRAEKYIKDIIRDLKHDEIGWIDWNLCLDTKGGPSIDKNSVDAPIIIDAEKQEFIKQPMFYALGHISKFIPRDSIVIGTITPPCGCSIDHVAVQTPKNTIVLVLHNVGDATSVTIKQGQKETTIYIEAKSIMTIEFLNE